MNYLNYAAIICVASLSAAVVCCAALWVMAPLILSRARPKEPEPGEAGPSPACQEAGEGCGVLFNFTPGQAEALAGLLEKENPDDIAIILSRLPSDSGRALFAALAPELWP